SALPEYLTTAPLREHRRSGRHITLHVGVGANHRGDVAAVEHSPRRTFREASLFLNQRTAYGRHHRDLRGGLTYPMGGKRFPVERAEIDSARRLFRRCLVIERQSGVKQRPRNGAIGKARIEMMEAIMRGQFAG